MTDLKSVDELWDEYSAVLPKDASRVQRRETMRAFYAGVYALLCELHVISELDDDKAMAKLEELHKATKTKIATMILEDTTGVRQ